MAAYPALAEACFCGRLLRYRIRELAETDDKG